MLVPKKYVSRDEYIIKVCKGQKVLHLGCVGFVESMPEQRIAQAKESLHFRLSQCCDVIGVDYSQDVIDFFKENNIFDNVVYGDVEKFTDIGFVKGQFNIIVVGDIIEHLSNPGLMLEGLKSILSDETAIIITTPSSTGFPNLLRFLFNKYREGSDHVLSFSIFTLTNLLDRHGYALDKFYTCYHVASSKKGSMTFKLGKFFISLFPKWGGTLFCIFKINSPDKPGDN